MRLKLFQAREWLLFLIVLPFFLGCQPRDNQYYRTHPRELLDALNTCVEKMSIDVQCQHLKKIADAFQTLSNALKADPQAFGKSIMKLETQCSRSKLSAKEKQSCRSQLEMRYAIVKWYESPGK